jgi:hypothetical protein
MTSSDAIRGANRFPAVTVGLRLQDPSTACALTDSSNRLEHLIRTSDYAVVSTWWDFIALFFGDVTACASAVTIGCFAFQSHYLARNFCCRPGLWSQSPEDLSMPGTAVTASVARRSRRQDQCPECTYDPVRGRASHPQTASSLVR